MDTQPLRDQDDMSDVERRLAAWQPKSEGLEPDAMLFAAGLAAGRRGPNRLWPALCALLLVQIAGLGMWAMSERSERLALAGRLEQDVPLPGSHSQAATGAAPNSGYTPSPNDYLHQRRRVEQDANFLLASSEPPRLDAVGHPLSQAAILRAGQWSDLLE